MDQMFEQMKAIAAGALPASATPEQRAKALEVQGKMFDLMKNRIWEKIRPQFAKAYSETFSEEEIDGMLAFYESPAGRAMIAKMPMLMGKVMAVTQAQMGDLMPEIQRITREAQGK
jgi:uncharacterized protein